MPEMPEVAALAEFLAGAAGGRRVFEVQVASIGALKTYDPAPQALAQRVVAGVHRYGKWLDVVLADPAAQDEDDDGALHLIFHLARAGWLRWHEHVPERMGRSRVLALRVRLGDGSGFDLTEAGTHKRLAVHIVTDPRQVEAIASLGPDPLADSFTPSTLAGVLRQSRHQVKTVLRDQSKIAGIGNAYSDEILHAARMSPFAGSATLSTEQVGVLHGAIREVLLAAITEVAGRPPNQLKDTKRGQMRVHGRTGQACPVCGDTVAEVSFADSSLQYCPTCQTGGKLLADRRMSRLLR